MSTKYLYLIHVIEFGLTFTTFSFEVEKGRMDGGGGLEVKYMHLNFVVQYIDFRSFPKPKCFL